MKSGEIGLLFNLHVLKALTPIVFPVSASSFATVAFKELDRKAGAGIAVPGRHSITSNPGVSFFDVGVLPSVVGSE